MVLSLITTCHHQYALQNTYIFSQFNINLNGNQYTGPSSGSYSGSVSVGGSYYYYIFTAITGASGGTTTLNLNTYYNTQTASFFVNKSDYYTFTATPYIRVGNLYVPGKSTSKTIYFAYFTLSGTPSINGSWTTNSTAGISAQLINLQGTYSYYKLTTTSTYGYTTTLPSTSQTSTSQGFYVSGGDQFTFNVTLYDTGSGTTITGYTYSFTQYVGSINVSLNGSTQSYSGSVNYGGYLYYVWEFKSAASTYNIYFRNPAPGSFTCEFFLVGGGGAGANTTTAATIGGGGGGGGQVIWPITNTMGAFSDTISITIGAGASPGNSNGGSTIYSSTSSGSNTAAGGGSANAASSLSGAAGNSGGNAGGGGGTLYSLIGTMGSSGSATPGGSGYGSGGNAGGGGNNGTYFPANGGGGGGASGNLGGAGYQPSTGNYAGGVGGAGYRMPTNNYALTNYSFGGSSLYYYYWGGGGGGGSGSSSAKSATNTGGNGGIGGGGGGAIASSKAGATGSGGGSAVNSGGNGTYASGSSVRGVGGRGGQYTGGGGGGGGCIDSNTGAGGQGGGSGGQGVAFFAIRFIT
jgi:hypothetical protein